MSNRKAGTRRSFLLEVGCEEIPATMLKGALEDLAARLLAALGEKNGLGGETDSPPRFGSPRRLVASITGILDREDDRVEVVTGPPVRASFDKKGRPTKAAEGFARAHGLSVDDLVRIETEKGEVVGAKRQIKGRTASEVLAAACPEVLGQMRFPKMMRWGGEGHTFVRPVHWIVALLDDQVVEFEFMGVRSGRLTWGHRFLGAGPHEIPRTSEYENVLREKGCVIPGNADRTAAILGGVQRESSRRGWTLQEDPELLEELTFLNEYPGVISGVFPEHFLSVPEQVLITSMRHHQKYFTVRGKGGKLAAGFLAVINQESDEGGLIARGNEWVLKARLADAEFFWTEDRKTRLEDRLGDLSRITFQEKLGDNLLRAERLESLASWLAGQVGLDESARGKIELAAKLCKTDLTTGMVGEFPELQGVMGGIYAREEGLAEETARAIGEHYLPASTDGALPTSREGALLALADKLDLLVGCFAAGLVPKGSADPLGQRRAAHGACRILGGDVLPADRISLDAAIRKSHETYVGQGKITGDVEQVVESVTTFIGQRLRHLMESAGISFDTARAVTAAGFDDLGGAWQRGRSLAAIRATDREGSFGDFEALATSAKRIRNILSQARDKGVDHPDAQVDEERLVDEREKELYADLKKVRTKVEEHWAAGRYDAIWTSIASLRPRVDGFFDHVMVMDEDAGLRRNRLALLMGLSDLLSRAADFSEIVVEGETAEGAG